MKKSFRLAAATGLAMVTVFVTTVQAQFSYTTNNGKIIITRYTGSSGDVNIPATINGLPVTRIGDDAFYFCDCLINVTIPDSVTSVGDDAFSSCRNLTGVSIPNSVIWLGDGAFYFCTSLRDVTIPNKITSIGYGAFSGCHSLTGITVDILNPAYSSVDGILFNKSQTTLLQYPGGKAGSYTIPNNVTSIGDYAFSDCTSLTSVTIGNSVTNIVLSAFSFCSAMTNVTIPDSVTSIGERAFNYCWSLTSITIPDGVTGIGDYAFYNCSSLTSITIPNNVASIGYSAFSDCTSLTSVTIGNSVTSIGPGAFYYCFLLTGVYFEGNAPTLRGDVFYRDDNATIYYHPRTQGWGTSYGGRPTALWMRPGPVILTESVAIQIDGFGFTISWPTHTSVVVDASTDLANPDWFPLATNTLANGSSYFSDPEWTKHPSRFYRVRSP